jgi:DNA-binding CsgD family transcriptional regulator
MCGADVASRARAACHRRAHPQTHHRRSRPAHRPGDPQIARLGIAGLSNPEIGAQLFMSPRTIEYHLHKVFTKLDISSRNQIHGVLANSRSE